MPRFTLKEDHIKLLHRAYVSWDACEFGAPAIDCKRPYGNSSVAEDIAEILDWKIPDEEEDNDFDAAMNELYFDAIAIHAETQTALQVILATGSFEPGEYEADPYLDNWRRV